MFSGTRDLMSESFLMLCLIKPFCLRGLRRKDVNILKGLIGGDNLKLNGSSVRLKHIIDV